MDVSLNRFSYDFSDSFPSGTHQLNIRVDKINLIFPSAGTGSWKSVACVSLVSWLSVVCGWSIRMPTVKNHPLASRSTGLPSRCHYPCLLESKYDRIFFSGLPRCIPHGWPPAWAGFHLFHSVFLSPGLPLCWASHVHTARPPA